LITSWADKKHQIVVEKSLHPSPGCPKTTQINKAWQVVNAVHNAATKRRYRFG
jgi:hypothetical protein